MLVLTGWMWRVCRTRSAKRRQKFSRRRAFNEDADINYINERNRVFNKKLKRYYDQYTSEIKNNIVRPRLCSLLDWPLTPWRGRVQERGTAL
jgi:hypothetical protein